MENGDMTIATHRCSLMFVCSNFGQDRLMGFGVARGRILGFPLTSVVALATLSHYRVLFE